jgi:hypothetical protein
MIIICKTSPNRRDLPEMVRGMGVKKVTGFDVLETINLDNKYPG